MAEKHNGTIEDVSIHDKKVMPASERVQNNMNQMYEENKIMDKTKFDKWLTDAGNDDRLDVPTVDIENELRVLIGLARKAEREKHEVDTKTARRCLSGHGGYKNNIMMGYIKDRRYVSCEKSKECTNKSCPLNEANKP